MAKWNPFQSRANPHGYSPAQRDLIQDAMRSHERRLRDIENADARLMELRGTSRYAAALRALEMMVDQFRRLDGIIRAAWQRALSEKATEEPIRTRTVQLRSGAAGGLGLLPVLVAIVVVAAVVAVIWAFVAVMPALIAALEGFGRALGEFSKAAEQLAPVVAPVVLLLGVAVVVMWLIGQGRRALA
jgi:hypothetical protein